MLNMLEDSDKVDGWQTKKKRLNKNKKKNWRKNIDISAIEEGLEVQRLELRTGGIISDKKNDEIFFIDKTMIDKTAEPKRNRKRNRTLRVDRIIVPDPKAVQPPTRIRKKVKLRAQKRLDKKLDRKAKAGSTTLPEVEETPFDLWADASLDLYDKETKKTSAAKYTELVKGQRHAKRPKHLENDPSDIQGYKYRHTPAIEVAHPGASYNPTYHDHQNLLAKAHLVEVEKIRAEDKIQKALHVPYDDLPDLNTNKIEMQEGLFESKNQEDRNEQEDKEEADPSDIVQNPPVRAGDRKTQRKRRNEEKEKREKQKREKIWGNKLRQNEVFRTKTFMAEIKAKDRKNAARRELRKKKVRLLTLSNVKFTEQDIELKLSDEIKGSLRELKPEAGLLIDRYKSFQKRGIVEPRCKRRVPKRKYKIKYQEKRLWREIEA